MVKPSAIDRIANYLNEKSKKPSKLAESIDAIARRNEKKRAASDRDAGSSGVAFDAGCGNTTDGSGDWY